MLVQPPINLFELYHSFPISRSLLFTLSFSHPLSPYLPSSTVNKPRSPRTADPPPPAFSSSSVLGGGLSELDHLLQELNATQFNITDEILAQFPTTKKDERDKIKEFQGSKDKVTTPYPRYPYTPFIYPKAGIVN
ncbi:transforming growth factor beta-1-induced transcript 1 protein-like [Oncorhynchus keta]|uniref:transforming growth factor beta-1-induced transcript 1 protein-like n=1 Tax=Oncorhynchus keta TaxID=8018 RepID=UPI00227C6C66|nr:transforming growth factor beta-1-induced transcript 1 protein-like [Oncorhynchus keta]